MVKELFFLILIGKGILEKNTFLYSEIRKVNNRIGTEGKIIIHVS